MTTLDDQPRTAGSPTPAPKHNQYAIWICVLMAIGAIIFRSSGFGLKLSIGAAIIAVVGSATLWTKVPASRRLGLLIAPSVITLVLLVVYLAIPHGVRVADTSSSVGSASAGDAVPATPAPAAPQSSASAAASVTTPSADMPLHQRLALWSKLIPANQISTVEPSVSWDNNAVLSWVNDWIDLSQDPGTTATSPYGGQYTNAYWLSYAAVADSHGPLAAKPATDGTSASFAYIDPNSGTIMTGSPGDAVRVLHGAVVKNSDGASATLTLTFTFTTANGRHFWVASVS